MGWAQQDLARHKEARCRPHREALCLDPESMYALIRFQREDEQVFDLSAGLASDSLTWAAPEFRFRGSWSVRIRHGRRMLGANRLSSEITGVDTRAHLCAHP